MRRRGTVTVACIAACGLMTTFDPAASAVLTTALVPLITPRDGAIIFPGETISFAPVNACTAGVFSRRPVGGVVDGVPASETAITQASAAPAVIRLKRKVWDIIQSLRAGVTVALRNIASDACVHT